MNDALALAQVLGKSSMKVRVENGFCEDELKVSIGGNTLSAIWLKHIVAEPGDPLTMLIIDYNDSTSSAPIVVGVTGTLGPAPVTVPSPIEGTVKTWAAGSLTATVTTSQGDKTAVVLSNYTPVVGDRVRLLWQTAPNGGMVCSLLAKIGSVTPPEPPAPQPVKPKPEKPAAPPPKPATGSAIFAASNSGTWSTGTSSWNSYYATDVMTGSGYGAPGSQHGAWFYHDKLSKLDGKKTTKVQVWLPVRKRVGNYNSETTFSLNLHTSKKRPSGNVNVAASMSITLPAGSRAQWIDLPKAWGDHLIRGHGLSISGGGYAGFAGVKNDIKSGRVRIYWEE